MIERARAAGYRALVLTIDTPVAGRRERDLRNGFTIPVRPTLRHAFDVVRHLPWFTRLAWDEAFGHGLRMGNFVERGGLVNRMNAMQLVLELFDPSITWTDLEWLKSIWGGPVVVKGVSTAEDARSAVEHGADAVRVSNHGGRQRDSLPSAIGLLPQIVDEIGDRTEFYLDGGIRRGSDVVKALALGATACMFGRPWVHALAARGEAGVGHLLDLFMSEIDTSLALLGAPSVATLDRTYLVDSARS